VTLQVIGSLPRSPSLRRSGPSNMGPKCYGAVVLLGRPRLFEEPMSQFEAPRAGHIWGTSYPYRTGSPVPNWPPQPDTREAGEAPSSGMCWSLEPERRQNGRTPRIDGPSRRIDLHDVHVRLFIVSSSYIGYSFASGRRETAVLGGCQDDRQHGASTHAKKPCETLLNWMVHMKSLVLWLPSLQRIIGSYSVNRRSTEVSPSWLVMGRMRGILDRIGRAAGPAAIT
jgi:hypothetical protein